MTPSSQLSKSIPLPKHWIICSTLAVDPILGASSKLSFYTHLYMYPARDEVREWASCKSTILNHGALNI